MAHLQFFSEERIALQREVKYHPKLVKILIQADIPANDFPARMAAAATYVNIALDDMYTDEDIDNICSRIISRLQDRRKIIILPSH